MSVDVEPMWGVHFNEGPSGGDLYPAPIQGCCWETFRIFACCGLVGNPRLTAKI